MSQFNPERFDGAVVNLANRIVSSRTVVASPSAASETIIAQITLPANVQVFQSVELVGWAAYTLGTNGVSAQFKIRQTNVSGTTIADTGATTGSAASLYEHQVFGSDASSGNAQVYVLTMTVASGSATSTVSAVYLRALVV